MSGREASLRPARARRSRDQLGTDSVRSKLPPLYVPVSPSPISREATRDLWRSIGPSAMIVFKPRTNVAVSTSTVSANTIQDLIFMFWAKRTLYFRHFRLDSTEETGVSVQRGRTKTAELRTSGAKRAETFGSWPSEKGVNSK